MAVARNRWWARGGIAALALAMFVNAGCAVSFKMGEAPKFDRLSELTPNVSTAKDIIALLGEPQGRGATRSPTYGLKDAWLYESMDVETGKAKMRMLMIFLDKDTHVYQGYMWLASGYLFGQTE